MEASPAYGKELPPFSRLVYSRPMSTIHIGAIAVDALVDGVLTFPLDRMSPAPRRRFSHRSGALAARGSSNPP